MVKLKITYGPGYLHLYIRNKLTGELLYDLIVSTHSAGIPAVIKSLVG